MSETAQCEKFVRNAWKKERCSNCFKSKEEHPEKAPPLPRIHVKLPDPPKQGILKGSKPKISARKDVKVVFPTTEFEVIGFGGDDVYSDDEDDVDFTSSPRVEEPDTDQDKAIQKLTKANTDFNSIPANLQGTQVSEPIKLGKLNTDNDGNKKTLLVSVTPFGAASTNGTARGRVQLKFGTGLPNVELTNKKNEGDESRVDGSESKPTVVETKKTDVEDVSPTTPVVISPKVVDIGIKRSQPIDKNSKFRPMKETNEELNAKNQEMQAQEDNRIYSDNKQNDKITTSSKVANLLDKAKKKVNTLPVIGDPNHFKFRPLDFTPISNKKAPSETTKSVILDMYELSNELESTENIEPDSPPEEKLLTVQVKSTPTIVFETKKSDETNCFKETDTKSRVPNFSSLHKTSSPEESTETDSPTNIICSSEDDAQANRDSVSGDKLDNFEGIIEGEEVTVFSLENENVEIGKQEETIPISEKPQAVPKELVDSFLNDTMEEPPALPLSPPPAMDPRSSFLHQLTSNSKVMLREKPKVPAKPAVIPNKKSQFRVFSPRPKSPSIETFLDSPVIVLDSSNSPVQQHLPLGETLSDSNKKRPAPQPPSPRASDILLRSAHSSENLLDLSYGGNSAVSTCPAPATRRSLSLSQDSLLSTGLSDIQEKKKTNKGKFSLRKLLHLGKSKEGKESERREYRIEGPPTPTSTYKLKSKPEIIHPLDLTGSRVEVVPPHRVGKNRRNSSSASSSSGELRESDIPSDSSASQSVSSSGNSGTDVNTTPDRSKKPPPPPRNLPTDQGEKPARPPPPKSIISSKRTVKELPPKSICKDGLYANIGTNREARSGLAPNKPVRTGSLREIDIAKKMVAVSGYDETETKKQYWTGSLRGPPKLPAPSMIGPPEDSGYESFDISLTASDSHSSSQTSSLTTEENHYECVQMVGNTGSPTENSIVPRTCRQINYRPERRSEGSVPDGSGGPDYIKYRFLRSVSMPYCGSEAESEIYSPYSFCGSEMGEDDYEWSPTSGRFQKVSRLKMKKGRSIVHKNLEDNYGAVIVANHEALVQVVDQMNQGPVIPTVLRPLSTAHNLRWSDFVVVKDSGGVTVGRRAFYPAIWGLNPVTLCLAPEQSVSSLHGKPPFSLQPLTELHDLVPACFLPDYNPQDPSLVQCSISVLSRIQIETLSNYSRSVSNALLTEETKKEVNFVLLQTINALKTLQAAGIEEAPRGLVNVVICREERDPHPRVCLLPSSMDECASLCSCLSDLLESLPETELSSLLSTTLRAEKAVSLSQAKALLEFTLWGPADITFGGGSRGASLQRWLDLERASVLHGLVRTRTDLSVFEEWHLLFLVHTNAKVLADASVMLEARSADC